MEGKDYRKAAEDPDRRQRQYRICNTLCNQIASDRQR